MSVTFIQDNTRRKLLTAVEKIPLLVGRGIKFTKR